MGSCNSTPTSKVAIPRNRMQDQCIEENFETNLKDNCLSSILTRSVEVQVDYFKRKLPEIVKRRSPSPTFVFSQSNMSSIKYNPQQQQQMLLDNRAESIPVQIPLNPELQLKIHLGLPKNKRRYDSTKNDPQQIIDQKKDDETIRVFQDAGSKEDHTPISLPTHIHHIMELPLHTEDEDIETLRDQVGPNRLREDESSPSKPFVDNVGSPEVSPTNSNKITSSRFIRRPALQRFFGRSASIDRGKIEKDPSRSNSQNHRIRTVTTGLDLNRFGPLKTGSTLQRRNSDYNVRIRTNLSVEQQKLSESITKRQKLRQQRENNHTPDYVPFRINLSGESHSKILTAQKSDCSAITGSSTPSDLKDMIPINSPFVGVPGTVLSSSSPLRNKPIRDIIGSTDKSSPIRVLVKSKKSETGTNPSSPVRSSPEREKETTSTSPTIKISYFPIVLTKKSRKSKATAKNDSKNTVLRNTSKDFANMNALQTEEDSLKLIQVNEEEMESDYVTLKRIVSNTPIPNTRFIIFVNSKYNCERTYVGTK